MIDSHSILYGRTTPRGTADFEMAASGKIVPRLFYQQERLFLSIKHERCHGWGCFKCQQGELTFSIRQILAKLANGNEKTFNLLQLALANSEEKVILPELIDCGCYNGLKYCRGGWECCGACDDPCPSCHGYRKLLLLKCQHCDSLAGANTEEEDSAFCSSCEDTGQMTITLDRTYEKPYEDFLNLAAWIDDQKWNDWLDERTNADSYLDANSWPF